MIAWTWGSGWSDRERLSAARAERIGVVMRSEPGNSVKYYAVKRWTNYMFGTSDLLSRGSCVFGDVLFVSSHSVISGRL